MLAHPADLDVLIDSYPDTTFNRLDGMDGALLGVCEREGYEPVFLYCENAILDILQDVNDWDYHTALEYYDYNVRGVPGVAFLSLMR